MTDLLLKSGADVNSKNNLGETALILTAKEGKFQIEKS